MDRTTRQLLDKAQESLAAARLLPQANYYGFAASRAYYRMFYAAEAALLALGLTFSKRSAVVAAFGQQLANKGLVPRHLHRYCFQFANDRRLRCARNDWKRTGRSSCRVGGRVYPRGWPVSKE